MYMASEKHKIYSYDLTVTKLCMITQFTDTIVQYFGAIVTAESKDSQLDKRNFFW